MFYTVMEGKIFILTTNDKEPLDDYSHSHFYALDLNGNGFTAPKYLNSDDENNHIHRVVNWQVQESEGHSHKIDIVGYISDFINNNIY